MALSISPSQFFEGNDGLWSTFNVNVGTPFQQCRVLPATSQSAIFVVLGQGCPEQDPGNCADLRGGIFTPDPAQDISWQPQQAADGDPYFVLPFDSEAGLPNYTANGEVGFDALRLDWTGDDAPSQPLKNQVIAGYAAPNPWLGMLGISGRPSHLFNASSSQNSTLQSLAANNTIQSNYWAYTAGASYKTPQVFASLTLGGYDAARVNISGGLVANFSTPSTKDLQVSIEHLTVSGDQTANAGGLPKLALIDSVVPEIWLPQQTCDLIASTIGLSWNDTYALYLINDTQHSALSSSSPSLTFFLAPPSNPANSTTITLPYAALALRAQFPLAGIQDNATTLRYFAVRPSNDSIGYYLGRVFLQEAYVSLEPIPPELSC
jgi:hypothetical protein